jgi:hypothetical protein
MGWAECAGVAAEALMEGALFLPLPAYMISVMFQLREMFSLPCEVGEGWGGVST